MAVCSLSGVAMGLELREGLVFLQFSASIASLEALKSAHSGKEHLG